MLTQIYVTISQHKVTKGDRGENYSSENGGNSSVFIESIFGATYLQ